MKAKIRQKLGPRGTDGIRRSVFVVKVPHQTKGTYVSIAAFPSRAEAIAAVVTLRTKLREARERRKAQQEAAPVRTRRSPVKRFSVHPAIKGHVGV